MKKNVKFEPFYIEFSTEKIYEPKRNNKKKEDRENRPPLCERRVTTVQYYKAEPVCKENKCVTCILMLKQSNMTEEKKKLDG